MKISILFYILLAFSTGTSSSFAASLLETDNSFAEEYKTLRTLLEKVQDRDTALLLKQEIEREIQYLNQRHQSGNIQFNALSPQEKKQFINKFQKNRYHCGNVTHVMTERKRILFNPELSIILRDTLAQIP